MLESQHPVQEHAPQYLDSATHAQKCFKSIRPNSCIALGYAGAENLTLYLRSTISNHEIPVDNKLLLPTAYVSKCCQWVETYMVGVSL